MAALNLLAKDGLHYKDGFYQNQKRCIYLCLVKWSEGGATPTNTTGGAHSIETGVWQEWGDNKTIGLFQFKNVDADFWDCYFKKLLNLKKKKTL